MIRAEYKVSSIDRIDSARQLDVILTKFRKKVNREGVLRKYRDSQEYRKPSEKRKIKRALASRRRASEARDRSR